MMDCSNRRLYIWSTETMLLTLIKWSLEHVGYKLLTLFYCDIMNSFWIISKDYMYRNIVAWIDLEVWRIV